MARGKKKPGKVEGAAKAAPKPVRRFKIIRTRKLVFVTRA